MKDLTSELHLWQSPKYQASDGTWHESFSSALQVSKENLTWDLGTILSIITLYHACGDSTLYKEIRRMPWLSRIDASGQCQLSDIPSHGRLWDMPTEIAKKLACLLYDEASLVCNGRKEIYILLSGGLDSRIIAAMIARLYHEGNLLCRPLAVTWGVENCRDVTYARNVAEILGLDWMHITFSSDDLLENVNHTFKLGCIFSPVHLHSMAWFKNVSEDALVIASSYGDSVGRAEYSGSHLLELNLLVPSDRLTKTRHELCGILIRPELCGTALKSIDAELSLLRRRASEAPLYALCDHERQGHYMRGQIAHAMSLIGQYCTLYQMFTDPAVYSYMWSIHPSLRDDRIYECLLEHLNDKLARLPWTRTNRALKGKTVGAEDDLQKEFHCYEEWISGPVYKRLEDYMDPKWFAETGIFDEENIMKLNKKIENSSQGKKPKTFPPYDIWLWLASFKKFVEKCTEFRKKRLLEVESDVKCSTFLREGSKDLRSWLRRMLSQSMKLRTIYKKIRRSRLKKKALAEYPLQFTKKDH